MHATQTSIYVAYSMLSRIEFVSIYFNNNIFYYLHIPKDQQQQQKNGPWKRTFPTVTRP